MAGSNGRPVLRNQDSRGRCRSRSAGEPPCVSMFFTEDQDHRDEAVAVYLGGAVFTVAQGPHPLSPLADTSCSVLPYVPSDGVNLATNQPQALRAA
jgi:hypothetical protein